MPPFSFDFEQPAVDSESARIRQEFTSLCERLDAEMKTIPDDKPELMEEKRDWNDRWDELSVSFSLFFRL
jgi:hypothetical protein